MNIKEKMKLIDNHDKNFLKKLKTCELFDKQHALILQRHAMSKFIVKKNKLILF